MTKCVSCDNPEVTIFDERDKPNRITDFTWYCTKCGGFGWVIGQP